MVKKVLRAGGLAVLAALVLFAAAGATLAFRGRLNQRDLAKVPILARFIAAEEETQPPPPTEEERNDALAKQSSQLLLTSGSLTVDELAKLASEMHEVKRKHEERLHALETERGALEEQKRDLDYRRRALERMMADVEAERAEVARLGRALWDSRTYVAEEDEKNLKKLARLFEGMRSDAAAGRAAELDDATVAKLLSYMKPRQASKLLEAIPQDRIKPLTERYRALMDAQQRERRRLFEEGATGAGTEGTGT